MKINGIILEILDSDCHQTKLAKQAFNTLSDTDFLRKFFCTKEAYLKRVLKYGDPIGKSLVSKIGLMLNHITK